MPYQESDESESEEDESYEEEESDFLKPAKITKQIKKGKKKFNRRNSKTDDTPRRVSTVNDTFLNLTVNAANNIVTKAKTALHKKKKQEDSDKESVS